MEEKISFSDVIKAFERVSAALLSHQATLLQLDQAIGDGDLGITMSKIAAALREYTSTSPVDDLGLFMANAGMVTNRAGSSSLGTLLATALMRAGKEARGLSELTPHQLEIMLSAANLGIQERGKAKLGDKTIVDALHPAAEAFAQAIRAGKDLSTAGKQMLKAAEAGRDQVTPLQSRIGRASWVGERTIGQVDPGCETLVVILRAIVE